MIRLARFESELDYWFRSEPPTCSVLWILGDREDLVAAMVRLSQALAPLECRAASCRPGSRPGLFARLAGFNLLLTASLEFVGSAIEAGSSALVRHASSKASVSEVASVEAGSQGRLWELLADDHGLRSCVGLFPAMSQVADGWTYSAVRLVLVAGTNLLTMGSTGPQDGLLHGFLADTLQAGGIAVIRGGLEMAGPGFALTGIPEHIDQVERAFISIQPADEIQVRHSVQMAGPWSTSAYRAYEYRSDINRWVPAGR